MKNLIIFTFSIIVFFACNDDMENKTPKDILIGEWLEQKPCFHYKCDTLIVNDNYFNSMFFSNYTYYFEKDTLFLYTEQGHNPKYNYIFKDDRTLVLKKFSCNLIGDCVDVIYKKK